MSTMDGIMLEDSAVVKIGECKILSSVCIMVSKVHWEGRQKPLFGAEVRSSRANGVALFVYVLGNTQGKKARQSCCNQRTAWASWNRD